MMATTLWLLTKSLIPAQCSLTITVEGDGIDNDCDGSIDEEIKDQRDNDGDGYIDEDLSEVTLLCDAA